jgi:uncharacterized membrane protein YcaP (DUF421 family)
VIGADGHGGEEPVGRRDGSGRFPSPAWSPLKGGIIVCKALELSNVVQNAIIGNDDSVTGGAVGAVTLIAVNAALNHLIAANATAARIFDGRATTVITGGKVVAGTLRRLGLRSIELDTAVRLQNADDISEIGHGSLEPGGQLVLTLKPSEQSATKADVAELTERLGRIEALLAQAR